MKEQTVPPCPTSGNAPGAVQEPKPGDFRNLCHFCKAAVEVQPFPGRGFAVPAAL